MRLLIAAAPGAIIPCAPAPAAPEPSEPETPAPVVRVASSPGKRARGAEDDETEAPPRKKVAETPVSIVPVVSSPGKRARDVADEESEAPPRKKQQSVGPRPTVTARANRATWLISSNLSETDTVPALTNDSTSESEDSLQSPASSSHSLSPSDSQCSVILVDKEKKNVWTVTKRMMEDIQGYLRVKARRVRRKEPDAYDASGSECSSSPRKRKANVDDTEPDTKRMRKSQ